VQTRLRLFAGQGIDRAPGFPGDELDAFPDVIVVERETRAFGKTPQRSWQRGPETEGPEERPVGIAAEAFLASRYEKAEAPAGMAVAPAGAGG